MHSEGFYKHCVFTFVTARPPFCYVSYGKPRFLIILCPSYNFDKEMNNFPELFYSCFIFARDLGMVDHFVFW